MIEINLLFFNCIVQPYAGTSYYWNKLCHTLAVIYKHSYLYKNYPEIEDHFQITLCINRPRSNQLSFIIYSNQTCYPKRKYLEIIQKKLEIMTIPDSSTLGIFGFAERVSKYAVKFIVFPLDMNFIRIKHILIKTLLHRAPHISQDFYRKQF